jgi:hypothetical protein
MTLALPVHHPKAGSGTILLRADVELSENTITRLKDMRIPEIWIRYPNMELVSEFINPQIVASRAAVAADVASAFNAASKDAHAKLDFTQYKTSMAALMDRLLEDPKGALFIGELVDSGQPAVRHGANVGFLAMLLGLKLGFYLLRERKYVPSRLAKDVTNLGVAGMLHDIGMTRLPDEVRERWRTTHDFNDEGWRKHVQLGYDWIQGSLGATAASAVLHHHQHFDGSGFPKRKKLDGEYAELTGSDIHVFARIICAADLFDRLASPAAHIDDEPSPEPPRPVVRVLRMLMSPPYKDWLDPVVLRALITVCPAYPPGTLVHLSTGQRAVVVDYDPTDPCRPIVHEILHFEDETFGERIDLREHHDIVIAECAGTDVTHDNFYPKDKHQFDLRALSKRMINAAHGQEDSGDVEVDTHAPPSPDQNAA